MKTTNDSPQAIVEYFFAEAPEHIKTAQLSEIEVLSPDKFKHILKIISLPLDPEQRKQLACVLGDKFIARLEKRYEVTQIIIKAEKEGIYDAIEHLSSKLPW